MCEGGAPRKYLYIPKNPDKEPFFPHIQLSVKVVSLKSLLIQVRADGLTIPKLMEAILELMPLELAVAHPPV